MAVSIDLLINAIIAGILLGGFYAAVTVGITISFGMLDIANIAQPAFILLGSYAAYMLNASFGVDPILVGVVMLPVFYVIGMAVYRLYYYSFELRGEQSIQGLAFFFGLLFFGEVALILVFGVDYLLGGMPRFPGMVIAAMLIGIVESITATFYGPSWAPAVAFGFLLIALAVRPAGLMGR